MVIENGEAVRRKVETGVLILKVWLFSQGLEKARLIVRDADEL